MCDDTYRMIRGEWVISFAKSHSRECALPMKGYAKGSLDHGKHKDELCTLYTTLMAIASRREVVT